ncbi:MAG: hypothetical protein Q9162_004738 [Coniocarpon cinnabarinum]
MTFDFDKSLLASPVYARASKFNVRRLIHDEVLQTRQPTFAQTLASSSRNTTRSPSQECSVEQSRSLLREMPDMLIDERNADKDGLTPDISKLNSYHQIRNTEDRRREQQSSDAISGKGLRNRQLPSTLPATGDVNSPSARTSSNPKPTSNVASRVRRRFNESKLGNIDELTCQSKQIGNSPVEGASEVRVVILHTYDRFGTGEPFVLNFTSLYFQKAHTMEEQDLFPNGIPSYIFSSMQVFLEALEAKGLSLSKKETQHHRSRILYQSPRMLEALGALPKERAERSCEATVSAAEQESSISQVTRRALHLSGLPVEDSREYSRGLKKHGLEEDASCIYPYGAMERNVQEYFHPVHTDVPTLPAKTTRITETLYVPLGDATKEMQNSKGQCSESQTNSHILRKDINSLFFTVDITLVLDGPLFESAAMQDCLTLFSSMVNSPMLAETKFVVLLTKIAKLPELLGCGTVEENEKVLNGASAPSKYLDQLSKLFVSVKQNNDQVVEVRYSDADNGLTGDRADVACDAMLFKRPFSLQQASMRWKETYERLPDVLEVGARLDDSGISDKSATVQGSPN